MPRTVYLSNADQPYGWAAGPQDLRPQDGGWTAIAGRTITHTTELVIPDRHVTS